MGQELVNPGPPLGQRPRGQQPGEPAESFGARGGSRRRLWLWVCGVCVITIFCYLLATHTLLPHGIFAEAAPVARQQATPVSVATVTRGKFNRYLSAIGSVIAFNTVTVKTRVDGQIIQVNFKEGQTVRQGDLLVQIDPRPYQVQLTQAEGQMAKDKATLADAKITLLRDRALLEQDVIARQDYDNEVSAVGQAAGSITSDQGAIDSARLNLTYCRIVAPITGRIGLRLVDVGNIVHATDTTGLAVITQLQPIAVTFSIPEDDLPQVVKDMRQGEELPVDAYNRDFTARIANGTLETFDSQIDQTTGTIKLKAIFANTDYSLFPNQFVNARVLVSTIRDATLVPTAAVQRNPQGTFVYAIKPDDTVEVRQVTVGASEGSVTSVISGLTPGDRVVTDGVDKLHSGSRVYAQLAANLTVPAALNKQ
jgi:membrane fusion protein, multidrug efflux system